MAKREDIKKVSLKMSWRIENCQIYQLKTSGNKQEFTDQIEREFA